MSSAHRFFLTTPKLTVDQTIDLAEIHHQLQVVLRLQAGMQIVLLDGQGRAFQAELVALTRKEARGRVMAEIAPPPEPTAQVTLYQCTLKADKFEWILQKGTELGVTRFVPVISQRSVVRPASAVLKKYERWRAIIREAAEQCGRGRLPELAPPLEWNEAIHHAQGLRLLPWEAHSAAATSIKTLFAHVDIAGAQTVNVNDNLALALLIGPEGGIAATEAIAAQAAGWQIISLGPRILRAETASITTIVLVMEYLNQL